MPSDGFDSYFCSKNETMKFTQIIVRKRSELPEFGPHFLEYEILKQRVGELGSGSKTRDKEALFVKSLETELEKVSQHATGYFRILRNRVVHLLRLLSADNAVQEAARVEADLNTVADAVVNLHDYIRLNITGFQKIIARHAKRTGSTAQTLFTARLQKVLMSESVPVHDWLIETQEPFYNMRVEGFLVALSDAFVKLRMVRSGSAGAATWEAPQSFQRSTSKYWVRAPNLRAIWLYLCCMMGCGCVL
jgi:SPX domain protein involved in polyphosphate accumulation